MAEDKAKIDLDNSEFLKKAGEALESIQNIGNPTNLIGLVKGLTKANAGLVALGVAVLALGASLKAVFDAENIRAVNDQFDRLTANAGIANETLKKGLLDANRGLLTETELLKEANKAIISMGDSAERLPEIFKLAQKAAVAGFGENVQKNFSDLTKAIAQGEPGMLKTLGIVVDQNEAYKKYAKTLGVTADVLTETGRRQALMNAALEQGEKAFKGVNPNAKKANDTFQQLISIWKELYDLGVLFFDKAFGRWIKDFLEGIKVMSGVVRDLFKMLLKFNGTLKEETIKASEETTQKVLIDKEKQRQKELQFQADILKMRQERLNAESEHAMTLEQVEAQKNERLLLLADEFELRRQEIRHKYQGQEAEQKLMLEELERTEREKRIQIEEEDNQRRLAALERQRDASQNAADGMANAFKAGAEKSRQSLVNWGKTGQVVFNSFSKHSTDAFLAMGAGTKTAGEAIRGMMFGVVADTAQAKGQEMMLAGIWPPNPAAIAGGAGLIALAGFLRAQAGGQSSLGGDVGGGGGGGTPGGGGLGATPEIQAEAAPKKAVNIEIAGNYYETEETRTRLVEMIREAGDATDFAIKPIRET